MIANAPAGLENRRQGGRVAPSCRECVRSEACTFSCLAEAQVDFLEREKVAHPYATGETVFYEGTPPLAIYCVKSGAANLYRVSRTGQQTVVGVRGPGELLGLRAVLTQRNYAATATTSEPSVICTVPRETFVGLIRECPSLALRLLEKLARDSHELQDRLIARALDSVTSRTARFLAALAEEKGSTFRPPMSRGQMALHVGTSPESLSRTLRMFAERGVIRLDRREISVIDLPTLRELANERG